MSWFTHFKKYEFFRANYVVGLGTIARIASGILKTKAGALILGPAGVGLLGIAGQMQLLLLTWGSLSMGAAFIQAFSSRLSAGNALQKRELLGTTFTVLFLFNLAFAGALFACLPWIAPKIFDVADGGKYLLPILIAVPFNSFVGAYFQGLLYSHGRYDWWAKSNIVIAFLELGLFLVGAWQFGVVGALWALAASTVALAAATLFYSIKLEPIRDMFRFSFSPNIFREMSASALSVGTTSTAAYLFGVFFRVFLVRKFGSELSGAYQAVCVLSGFYTQMLTNSVWAQLFPLASRNGRELGSAWSENIVMTAVLGCIGLTALLVEPQFFISLLFSEQFGAAASFIALLLLGDFFFLVAQPSLGVILGRRRLKQYGLVWCTYFLIFAELGVLCSEAYGAKGIGFAHLYANGFLAAAALVIYLQAKPAAVAKTLLFSVGFAAILVLQFFLSSFASGTALYLRGAVFLFSLVCGISVIVAYKTTDKVPLPLKTRVLNVFRALFQLSILEKGLVYLVSQMPKSRLLFKVLPNHYQYPKRTLRTVVRNGVRYELDIGNFIDWHIYFGQTEGVKDALYQLANTGDTVIDVGANIGETAFNFARVVGSKGRVLAFEPDPEIREKLKRNMDLNSFENIALESYALSDKQARHKLFRVSERNPGGNKILEDGAGDFVEVEALRLDDYLKERLPSAERVKLIKIDVEGFEMNVLKGAEATILRHRPVLFVEISDENLAQQGTSSEEVVRLIASWGYDVVRADDHVDLTHEWKPDRKHFDVICRPRG